MEGKIPGLWTHIYPSIRYVMWQYNYWWFQLVFTASRGLKYLLRHLFASTFVYKTVSRKYSSAYLRIHANCSNISEMIFGICMPKNVLLCLIQNVSPVCRLYCYQGLWHNQHSHSGTKRAKHPFHHHPGTNVIINTIVTDTVIIVIIIIMDQLLAGAMRCKNNIGVIINISYGRH